MSGDILSQAHEVSNTNRAKATAEREASANKIKSGGEPKLWKRAKLSARNVLLGLSVITGAGAVHNLTGLDLPKPLPPVMSAAGDIDKAAVNATLTGLKKIGDQISRGDRIIENANNYPNANLAFSGDVDIPADIVDQYSEFGRTPVPDGNQAPYRVPQPAVRQEANANGNGFTDILVIPVKDKNGNPTFVEIQFTPSDTTQNPNLVCVSKPGTLEEIDNNGNTVLNGVGRNAQDLGTGAMPDPGFGQ